MNNIEEKIRCTICKSTSVREFISLSENKKVLVCRHCKNAFTYPKPTVPDYSAEDFQARRGDTDVLTKIEDLPNEIEKSYEVQLAMIKKYLPQGSAILEIGAGEGIFADLVKNAGYNVDLVEPSVTASTRARKRGLQVHADYIQNITFNKKFGLICMSHVLEHIDDPISALEKIQKLLHPNGFILLAQTNFNGFMPKFFKEQWYAWVPEQHFSHFSLPGLRYLAGECNMSVATYKYSRLVHGPSIYHKALKHIPFMQDQIHILMKLNEMNNE